MTTSVNWSWEAPTQYWNTYGGATVILPNGDYLGGSSATHHINFHKTNRGTSTTRAVLVEVNPNGQIVRTWTFPVGCYIYRVEAITNLVNTTPTVSPTSTTPLKTINSQTIITSGAIIGAILVIAILSIIFILRKRPIRFLKKESDS